MEKAKNARAREMEINGDGKRGKTMPAIRDRVVGVPGEICGLGVFDDNRKHLKGNLLWVIQKGINPSLGLEAERRS